MTHKNRKIEIKGKQIGVASHDKEDFICLTDIAKYKNSEATGLVMSHWLSTRYTIEFMGLWEKMHNPDFNVTEVGNIRSAIGIAISQMKILVADHRLEQLEKDFRK